MDFQKRNPKSLQRLCQEKILTTPHIYELIKYGFGIIPRSSWDKDLELLYISCGKLDADNPNEITPREAILENYNFDSSSSDEYDSPDDNEFGENHTNELWFNDWSYISSSININKNVPFFQVYHIYIDWDDVVENQIIYPETIYKIYSIINGYDLWDKIIKYQKIVPEQLIEYSNHIDWTLASRCQCINKYIITHKHTLLNWTNIVMYQHHLPTEFLWKYNHYINWNLYIKYKQLDYQDIIFLIENRENIIYPIGYSISRFHLNILNEEIIDRYHDIFDWEYISTKTDLSLDFITKYKNKINWKILAMYNNLPMYYLLALKTYVNWLLTFTYHPELTKTFIRDNKYLADQDLLNIIEYEYGNIEDFSYDIRHCILLSYLP